MLVVVCGGGLRWQEKCLCNSENSSIDGGGGSCSFGDVNDRSISDSIEFL
jgi:hypothetical protein